MTTETTIEIPGNIRCTFDVSGRGSYRRSNCGAQAVALVSGWRGRAAEGRCKKHASVDARRTYKVNQPVEVTHEEIAKILAAKAEADAYDAERRASQKAEAAARHAAFVERRAEEAKIQYTAVRKDEETGWGEHASTNPKWYVHRLDASIEMLARSLSENSAEVIRADDVPTVIKLRASSELDIAEAEALVVALNAAIAEAKR